MKLNESCITAILQAVQDVSTMDNGFNSKKDIDSIVGGYSEEEIIYHVRQCELNGFLYGYKPCNDGSFEIDDLTPKGHEYLERNKKFWGDVKPVSQTLNLPKQTINILKAVKKNDGLINPYLVVNGCSDDENWPRLQQLFDENLLYKDQGYSEDGSPDGPVLRISNEGKAFLTDYESEKRGKRNKDIRTIFITALTTIVINWGPKIILFLIGIIKAS